MTTIQMAADTAATRQILMKLVLVMTAVGSSDPIAAKHSAEASNTVSGDRFRNLSATPPRGA